MRNLSQKQRAVLRFIFEFAEQFGRCPTGPEIARQFELKSVTGGYQFLDALERKGYLDKGYIGERAISIRLTEQTRRLFAPSWPVIGEIPASPVSELFEEPISQIQDLVDLLPMIKEGDFFLIVRGDSMIGDGIQPGQLILVRPNVRPQPDDICAIFIQGRGGTLKRLIYQDDEIRLIASNPQYPDMIFPANEVVVQGVVVASIQIRKLRG